MLTRPSSDLSSATPSPPDPAADVALTVALPASLLAGMAVFFPFAVFAGSWASQPVSVADSLRQAWLHLLCAVLLLGTGCGFALQKILRFRVPVARRAAVAALLSAAGLLLTALTTSRPVLLLAAFFAGMALWGDWAPSADLLRRSVPPIRLWSVLRWHGLLVYGGAAFIVLTTDAIGPGPAGLLTVLGSVPLLVHLFRVPEAGTPDRPEPAEPENPPKSDGNPTGDSCDEEDSCDEDDCCGGGCRWIPTPVRLGIGLMSIGWYVLAGVLPVLAASDGPAVFLLVVGAAAFGSAAFRSVVPDTGYAVLLLPCLLIGLLLFGLAGPDGAGPGLPWLPAVLSMTCAAAVSAALGTGFSGLAGESFSDSGGPTGRSFVLMTAAFAAAGLVILELVVAASGRLSVDLFRAGVCLIGLFLLRRIPSPMLSSRGEEECPSADTERILSDTEVDRDGRS